ncbi:MAG: hypothetical protein AB7T07_10210 [Steroidobacteraceae bacterium]
MTNVTRNTALSGIPVGLRTPLLAEFSAIISNFTERRWASAELSGGRFCEIVYTILDGHARSSYAASPMKPSNFVDACRRLEGNTGVPRSFQILIPRLLPALYEIRNNRNVGHVGGDVSPDFMDSSAVVSMSSWILAELVRVLHAVSTDEAQAVVTELAERRLPLVWRSGEILRVLNPELPLKSQILLLLASSSTKIRADNLLKWTGYKGKPYFKRLLRQMHEARLIEFYELAGEVELLPPGADEAAFIATTRNPHSL